MTHYELLRFWHGFYECHIAHIYMHKKYNLLLLFLQCMQTICLHQNQTDRQIDASEDLFFLSSYYIFYFTIFISLLFMVHFQIGLCCYILLVLRKTKLIRKDRFTFLINKNDFNFLSHLTLITK